MAEKIRERVDPDDAINLALEVVADLTIPIERRLAAMWSLIDRGYRQPPAGLDLSVTSGTTPHRDYSQMPLEERRALLEKLRSIPQIGASPDQDPRLQSASVPDDSTR